MERYQPPNHESMRCDRCAAATVDSANSSTGHFYLQYGRLLAQRAPWAHVSFAICATCERALPS